MNEIQQSDLQHKLTLQERETLQVSGVTEVESFDEESVKMVTGRGDLTVNGKQLRLLELQPETGDMRISGQIDSIAYSVHPQRSFIKRIFK